MSSNLPSPEQLQEAVIRKIATAATTTQTPTVSVVTACFNPLKDGREILFRKSLDSVQQQTGITLEHIIVDGASTDGTLELLNTYNNKHHDIRILSMPDSGIYEAMNRGIALAQGKYIIFLNTDDYYHRPDGLYLSARALEKSMCAFTFAPILPTGSRLRHRLHRHPQNHLHRFFLFCTIPHPSMLFRKEALMEIGGYDCSYKLAADYDMMLRLIAAKHRVCFVDKAFVTFASDGFSNKNRALNIKEKTLIVSNFHKQVFGISLTDTEKDMLVKRYRYPRKYLSIYVASQQMIDQTFVGIPHTLWSRLSHCFNYWKYFIKCLFGI